MDQSINSGITYSFDSLRLVGSLGLPFGSTARFAFFGSCLYPALYFAGVGAGGRAWAQGAEVSTRLDLKVTAKCRLADLFAVLRIYTVGCRPCRQPRSTRHFDAHRLVCGVVPDRIVSRLVG